MTTPFPTSRFRARNSRCECGSFADPRRAFQHCALLN